MVPVPEELAAETLQFIRWKGSPQPAPSQPPVSGGPSDADAATPGAPEPAGSPLERCYADLDASSQALLTTVASKAIEAEAATVTDVARALGCSERETIGTMLELNNRLALAGGSPFTVLVKNAPGASADQFSYEQRVMVMTEGIARQVLAAAASSGRE